RAASDRECFRDLRRDRLPGKYITRSVPGKRRAQRKISIDRSISGHAGRPAIRKPAGKRREHRTNMRGSIEPKRRIFGPRIARICNWAFAKPQRSRGIGPRNALGAHGTRTTAKRRERNQDNEHKATDTHIREITKADVQKNYFREHALSESCCAPLRSKSVFEKPAWRNR